MLTKINFSLHKHCSFKPSSYHGFTKKIIFILQLTPTDGYNHNLRNRCIRLGCVPTNNHRILNFIRNSGFVLDQVLLKAGPCHAERMISECISLFAFRKSYFPKSFQFEADRTGI